MDNLLKKLETLKEELEHREIADTFYWNDEAYCSNCSIHYDDGFINGYDQGKYDLVKELLNDLRGV